MDKLIFSIDWGETIGFSVMDSEGFLVLLGNTDEHTVVAELFYTLAPRIGILTYENINATNSDKLTVWLSILSQTCVDYNIKTITVSPSSWKNSWAKKLKPRLTNHAGDSAKIALYTLGKYNKP